DALLDEPVMRAEIVAGEIAVAEGAVAALVAAGEDGDGGVGQRRAHHAGGDQRRDGADAVRSRQAVPAHRVVDAGRPVDSRMLGPHRKADVEGAEIEGDQVVERRPFDGVEAGHPIAMALEDLRRDLVRLKGTDINAGKTAHRIPASDAELAARGAADG